VRVGLSILYKVTIPPAAASNTTIKNLMISVCNLISSLVPSVVKAVDIRSGKNTLIFILLAENRI
jgi:hypothetical protein